jgi:hypothetical protein
MTREVSAGGTDGLAGRLQLVESDRLAEPGAIPACAALSPAARLVLGCVEILDAPSVDGLAQVTGLSSAEIRRCLGELIAIGAAMARRDGGL